MWGVSLRRWLLGCWCGLLAVLALWKKRAFVPGVTSLDAGIACLLGGLLLHLSGTNQVLHWLAFALFLLAANVVLPGASAAFRAEMVGVAPLWEKWGAYVLTLGVVLWALGPVSLGQMPISQDHANHYLATRIFVEDLVWKGRWFGWTDRISTGLPFGDVYATSIYVVTGLLSLLSFGLISFQTSYSFGMILVWLVPCWAIVAWTKRLTGGVWPAVFAGAFFVLDVGGNREGGWIYSMFHGVWPQLFATGVWLWGILAVFRLLEKRTWRRFSWVALLAGWSLWLHPMNAVNWLITGILLVLVLFVPGKREAEEGVGEAAQGDEAEDGFAYEQGGVRARRGGFWVVVALSIAVFVGFGWLSRMLVAAPEMKRYVAYWKSLPALGLDVWSGHLFQYQLPLVGLLALVGLLVVLRKATRFGLLTVLAWAVFLTVGGMDFISSFDLGVGEKGWMFMFRRFSVSAKPLWYACAGVGLGVVWKGAWNVFGTRAWLQGPMRWVVLLLLAPMVSALYASSFFLVHSPAADPLTAKRARLDQDLVRLRAFLQAERKKRKDGLLRVIHWRGKSGNYTLLPIAEAKWSYLPTYRPPCQTLEWINARRDLKMMRWLGGSLLISYVPTKRRGLSLYKRIGKFYVYRVAGAKAYPVMLKGQGRFQVKRWRDMEKRFVLRGVTKSSVLVVGFPPYRKWEARQGGRLLKMGPYSTRGYRFSQISGLRDGEVVLRFRDRGFERVAFALSVLLVLALCIGIGWGGGSFLPQVVSDRGLRLLGVSVFLCFVGGGLATLLILQERGRSAVNLEWTRGEKGMRVIDVLHRRGPFRFVYHPRPFCVRPFTRRVGRCNERRFLPHLRLGTRRGRRLPACVRFGVPGKGKASLSFRLPRGGMLLKGRLHWLPHKTDALLIMGKKSKPLRGGWFRFVLRQPSAKRRHKRPKGRRIQVRPRERVRPVAPRKRLTPTSRPVGATSRPERMTSRPVATSRPLSAVSPPVSATSRPTIVSRKSPLVGGVKVPGKGVTRAPGRVVRRGPSVARSVRKQDPRKGASSKKRGKLRVEKRVRTAIFSLRNRHWKNAYPCLELVVLGHE